MAPIDYYKIISAPRDAGLGEIKAALLEFTKIYHPDRNPGSRRAADRMMLINKIRGVLLDPEKKREYDAELDAKDAKGRGGRRGGPGFPDLAAKSRVCSGCGFRFTIRTPQVLYCPSCRGIFKRLGATAIEYEAGCAGLRLALDNDEVAVRCNCPECDSPVTLFESLGGLCWCGHLVPPGG